MVNYSAYQVNPQDYLNAGVKSMMSAYQMRDDRNQNAARNALDQQRLGLEEQRIAESRRQHDMNASLDGRRIDEYAKRTQQDADTQAITNYVNALKIYNAVPTKEGREKFRPALAKKFNLGEDQFPEIDDVDNFSITRQDADGGMSSIGIKGTQKDRHNFLNDVQSNPAAYKNDLELARLAEKNNVSLSVERKFNPKEKTSKDDSYQREKDRKKEFDEFVSRNVDNALSNQQIYKDKDGRYYAVTGVDEYGEEKREPAGQDAVATIKRTRYISNLAKKMADEENISFDDALLKLEMMDAQRQSTEEYNRAKAERDAQEIRGRAGAYTPSAPSASPPVPTAPAQPQQGGAGFWESLNKGDFSNAYDAFGKWNERRRQAAERLSKIK